VWKRTLRVPFDQDSFSYSKGEWMTPGGEQKRKPRPKQEEGAPQEKTETKNRTKDTDELLDEIDEVLEANAEEFVRGFVQKGGE
jgi:prokaryotic ubiquitin-like protein Pup